MRKQYRISVIFIFTLLILADSGFCQKKPGAEQDSLTLYRDIESYSGKRKFTKFMYRLIFKPVAIIVPKKKVKKRVYKKLIQKPYSTFEGKIIRYIGIETLDPFGYTVADTIVSNQNYLSRAGNNLHIKSQRITIRNLLLIKKNQVFDSLLVKESERLVRSQPYVRDVLFYVVLASKNSDSVDIFIRELDQWSLIPKGSFSKTAVKIQLNDKNFLGFGHEFKNAYYWYHDTGDDAYITSYFIPNIRNTYVNATVKYGTDEFGNFTKSVAVDRPFFSPFAKWAAGVAISKNFSEDSVAVNDSVNIAQGLEFIKQDYWAGQAIRIFKGNTENNRTTNFIYSFRYTHLDFQDRPSATYDTLHTYANENFYLGSIGISTRKYVRDKYIFGFGVTEDVPIGRVYSVTGGYLERRNSGNMYLGARIAVGNYYPWGYFSTNYEFGTFFRSGVAQLGVAVAGINYFTGLIQIGKWKFRQFVKPEVTVGIKRNVNDSITIKDGYGLDGFNSTGLSGTNRILFSLQTQAYAPWEVIGFKFGPYLIYSIGMLGDAATGFRNSKVYSQIGLGVLIRNEHLVIETFQLSISFYPLIPGLGNDVFKFNSFKTTDFGFRDFDVGKPGIVAYQ